MRKETKTIIKGLSGWIIVLGIFAGIALLSSLFNKHTPKSIMIKKKKSPRIYTKYWYHHADSIYIYSIKLDTVMKDNTTLDDDDQEDNYYEDE